jgi:hypothetical protein
MVKEDIKKVKDQGKLFERLSSDYDAGKFPFQLIYFQSNF